MGEGGEVRKQIIIKPHDWDIPNLPTCYNLFGAPTSVPLAFIVIC